MPAAGVVVVPAAVVVASKVEVPVQQSTAQKMEPLSDSDDGDKAGSQGDIQPVGHDYVEEVRNECAREKIVSILIDNKVMLGSETF